MGCNYTKEQIEAQNKALSDELEERPAVRITILINSVVLLLSGLVCIIGEGLLLSYSWKPVSPIVVCSGIWGGVYILILGSIAFSSRCMSVNPAHRCGLFYSQFGIAMGSFGITSQILRLHLESYKACKEEPEKYGYCSPNGDQIINASLALVIMAAVQMACAIVVFGYYMAVTCSMQKKRSSFCPTEMNQQKA